MQPMFAGCLRLGEPIVSRRVRRVLANASLSTTGGPPRAIFTARAPWPEQDFGGPNLDVLRVFLSSQHAPKALQMAMDLGLGLPAELLPSFRLVRAPGSKLYVPAFSADDFDLLVPGVATIERRLEREMPALVPIGPDELDLGLTPGDCLAVAAQIVRWFGADLVSRIAILVYPRLVMGHWTADDQLSQMPLPQPIRDAALRTGQPILMPTMVRRFALDALRLGADADHVLARPSPTATWLVSDLPDASPGAASGFIILGAWLYQAGALGRWGREPGWMERAVAEGFIGDIAGMRLINGVEHDLRWQLINAPGRGAPARTAFRQAVEDRMHLPPEDLAGLAATVVLADHPGIDPGGLLHDERVRRLVEELRASAITPRALGRRLLARVGDTASLPFGWLPPSAIDLLAESPCLDLGEEVRGWGPDRTAAWLRQAPSRWAREDGRAASPQDERAAFEDAVVGAAQRLDGVRGHHVIPEDALQQERKSLVAGTDGSGVRVPDVVIVGQNAIVAIESFARQRTTEARDGDGHRMRSESQHTYKKYRQQVIEAEPLVREIIRRAGHGPGLRDFVGLVVVRDPVPYSVAMHRLGAVAVPTHYVTLYELDAVIDAVAAGVHLADAIRRWQSSDIPLPFLSWLDEFGAGRLVDRQRLTEERSMKAIYRLAS